MKKKPKPQPVAPEPKGRFPNVRIDFDASQFSTMLKDMSSKLAASAGAQMDGFLRAAMKAEAEKVKADAMMRVPIRTNALRNSSHSGKGGLFGSKADFMIIDDPALDIPAKKNALMDRIIRARGEYLKTAQPLDGAELWLTADQRAELSTHTRTAVIDGSHIFGMTVRTDYHGGSMIEPPYIIGPAPKVEPGGEPSPFKNWPKGIVGVDWGAVDGEKVGAIIHVKKPNTYVTPEQAEAYAAELLEVSKAAHQRRQVAFTTREGPKGGAAPEVPVVASTGRFVEVPED